MPNILRQTFENSAHKYWVAAIVAAVGTEAFMSFLESASARCQAS